MESSSTSHPNFVHESHDAPNPSKKNTLLIAVVIVQFFIILALGGVFVYLLMNENRSTISNTGQEVSSNTPNTANNSSTNSSPIARSHYQVGFLRNNDLWVLDKDNKEEQVTKTNGTVTRFVFSPDNTKVAYMVGRDIHANKYLTSVKVMLYDLEKKETKEIFAFEPVLYPQAEYGITLRDIAISNDGKKIVFSTSDAIYIYDTVNDKTQRVYYAPREDIATAAGIFAYFDFKLSPDQTKLLLKKGFYEGFARATLDLRDGKMYDLPIEANGYGSWADDFWTDSETIGVIESFDDSTARGFTSTYYTLPWIGGAKRII